MNLTQEDRTEVLAKIAKSVTDKIQPTDLDSIIVVPMAMVCQSTGLGPLQIGKRLPVVNLGTRTRGVTLAALKAFIASRTTPATP